MDSREREDKQRRRTQRERQEDKALARILFWLGGAVLLELLLLLVNRYYVNYDSAGAEASLAAVGAALYWGRFLGIGAGVAGLVWAWVRSRAGKESVPLWAASLFLLAAGVCGTLVYARRDTLKTLLFVVPVIAVLALIYYLYQWEFFLVALTCTLGILGLWLLLQNGGRNAAAYGSALGLWAAFGAVAGLVRLAQKHGGRIPLGGKSYRLFDRKVNYVMLYLTCALMALSLVLALLVGTAVAVTVYYAVPVAWLLIMAVYYTSRLM